jgi:hypothetical protein
MAFTSGQKNVGIAVVSLALGLAQLSVSSTKYRVILAVSLLALLIYLGASLTSRWWLPPIGEKLAPHVAPHIAQSQLSPVVDLKGDLKALMEEGAEIGREWGSDESDFALSDCLHTSNHWQAEVAGWLRRECVNGTVTLFRSDEALRDDVDEPSYNTSLQEMRDELDRRVSRMRQIYDHFPPTRRFLSETMIRDFIRTGDAIRDRLGGALAPDDVVAREVNRARTLSIRTDNYLNSHLSQWADLYTTGPGLPPHSALDLLPYLRERRIELQGIRDRCSTL